MYPQAVETFSAPASSPVTIPRCSWLMATLRPWLGMFKKLEQPSRKLQQLAGTRSFRICTRRPSTIGLGEADEAFRLLDLAYEERIDRLVYLNVDPMADPIAPTRASPSSCQESDSISKRPANQQGSGSLASQPAALPQESTTRSSALAGKDRDYGLEQIKQTFGASTECGQIPRPAGAPPAPAGRYTPRKAVTLVRFSHIFHRKPQGAADSP